MDQVQKTIVRLSHWIDHNVEHIAGYQEAADSLEREGFGKAAESVRRGISLIEEANRSLDEALSHISDADQSRDRGRCGAHHEHGSHGHHHHGSHGHEHGPHDHDHSHSHARGPRCSGGHKEDS
jgi:hypothetical protein